MKKIKQKFDNMSSNVKSYGTIVSEGVKVMGLKAKIAQRKQTNNALKRMGGGKRLQSKDSLGLANATNKNQRKW